MFDLLPARWLALLTVLVASGAGAQPTPLPAPTPTAAPAPYRSALDGYQPFVAEPLQPWKESNDTVGRIGGWKAYAREAQGQGTPAPAQSAPAAADPHAGHGEKKP